MTNASHPSALRVDSDRGSLNRALNGFTGIYVRAMGLDGKYGSYDIAELDRHSLLSWTKEKDRLWLENLILILLKHQ